MLAASFLALIPPILSVNKTTLRRSDEPGFLLWGPTEQSSESPNKSLRLPPFIRHEFDGWIST